ncbi:bacteriohemerythrin [Azospirillum sp. TSO22-1]|uniref:bacteriohemerythrin n=1 Tax=Azospirillum sp. TSO22-1 TaxID=716789 RepID=UPI000D654172|nr:bacteriohemerythrin [Azospirillum sp. TSO22-1]
MPDVRIRWSEALAVGAAALDTDHQHLFALTNEVLAAMLDGRGPSVVKAALAELETYTRQHFSREEALLFETGYPEAEAHRASHAHLLAQMEKIRAMAGAGQPERVARFLQSWILDHILVSDMDYARFLRKRARSEAPADVAQKILVVESSRFFAAVLQEEIQAATGLTVETCGTFAEARLALRTHGREYLVAVLNVILPDAADGAVASLCRETGVPTVVFSGTYSEDLRERLTAEGVIDYIVKDTPASIGQLVSVIRRLVRNRHAKALVVDDSVTSRSYIGDLLRQYNFRVLLATNGQEALEQLAEHPDVSLVISDFHMPRMDGIEMVKRMRATHSKERLCIIGLSSGGGTAMSARFLKAGANDFLPKPFLREEFYCRVAQNMELLELITSLREVSTTDYLTGLYNRRHFYDVGETLFASMQRGTIALTAAIIDIDHFKRINDTLGHDAGDHVLTAVARNLRAITREAEIIARIGGEEFAVLAINLAPDAVHGFFERLRAAISGIEVSIDGKVVPVTASIGVCTGAAGSLDAMMSKADEMLYLAKRSGRNRVEVG